MNFEFRMIPQACPGEVVQIWRTDGDGDIEPTHYRLDVQEGQAILTEPELRTLAIALNMAADELKERSDAAR